MPISVGEVETVLTARDNASAAIAAYTAKIQQLEFQLGTMGTSSVASFTQLNNQLLTAQAGLAGVQAGADGAVSGLGSVKAAAESAAGSDDGSTGGIGQLDALATRMIARLAILYAVRGTFLFIEDVFNGAQALMNLSVQTDLSLGLLQQLQYVSGTLGIPFSTTTGAIDTFDKKLAESKATTSDALGSIGLSFNDVFSQDSDDRIQLVLSTLAGIPDVLVRTKAEAELFGTDGIDPLVMKFGQLKDAATVQSDSAIQQLAIADETYKNFFNDLKIWGADAITGYQGLVTAVAEPIFTGNWDTWGAYVTKIIAGIATGGNLGLIMAAVSIAYPSIKSAITPTPAGDTTGFIGPVQGDFTGPVLPQEGAPGGPGFITGPTQPGQPTATANQPAGGFGWDYISYLENVGKATEELTDDQKDQMDTLKQLNLLTQDNAVRLQDTATGLNVTTEQYKAYVQAMKDAEAASKAAAVAETQRQQAIITGYKDEITQLTAMQAAQSKSYGPDQRIADINYLISVEQTLTSVILSQIDSVTKRAEIQRESDTKILALRNQILQIEMQILATTNSQITAELNARVANNAAQGLSATGGPATSSLSPADAAEKAYETGMADLALAAQAVTDRANAMAAALQANADALFASEGTTNKWAAAQEAADSAKQALDTTGINQDQQKIQLMRQFNDSLGLSVPSLTSNAAATAKATSAITSLTDPTTVMGGAARDAAGNLVLMSDQAMNASSKFQSFAITLSNGDLQQQAAARGGTVAYDSYGNPYVYIPGVSAPPPANTTVAGVTSIPHFAGGGTVSKPTLALIGEGGEAEHIIPQSVLTGMLASGGKGITISVVMQVSGILDNSTINAVTEGVSDKLMRKVKQSLPLTSR